MKISRVGEDHQHSLVGRSPSPISPTVTEFEVPGTGGPWTPLSLLQGTIREGSGLLSSRIEVESARPALSARGKISFSHFELMSTSARKPSGPTAILVVIPHKRLVGGLDDFLDLLPGIGPFTW